MCECPVEEQAPASQAPMRVAIIGGGASGIVSAKHAKEVGLIPIVFESSRNVGGIWRQTSEVLWKSLKTNLSRHTCVYSDFPWRPSTPEFPDAKQMGSYIASYARHFDLEPYIRLNSHVHSVKLIEGNAPTYVV